MTDAREVHRDGPRVKMTVAQRGALSILALAQFTATLEFTIVFVALPSIGRDLSLSSATLAWVAGAYAVTFGGFLVLGGSVADRIGARRLFLYAAAGFGGASAIGALATSPAVLLIARAGQGLAASMLQPAVMGLVQTTFPSQPLRGRAWGVWAGVGAAGLAAGALLGGLLTAISWRWTFAINVPLMAMCALGAAVWIASRQLQHEPRRLPLRASVLGAGVTVVAALGLTAGGETGWTSPITVTCAVLVVPLALSFVRNERNPMRALLEPSVRQLRSMWAAASMTALYMASVGSAYFVLTFLWQNLWDYSAIQAGLAFLPLALMVSLGSTLGPRLITHLGAWVVLITGFGLATMGLAWLTVLGATGTYTEQLPGLLISGLGNGIVFTAMFAVGTRDVPSPVSGTAGGILSTSQYLASTVALAVAGTLLGEDSDAVAFQHVLGLLAAAAVVGVLVALLWAYRLGRE